MLRFLRKGGYIFPLPGRHVSVGCGDPDTNMAQSPGVITQRSTTPDPQVNVGLLRTALTATLGSCTSGGAILQTTNEVV